MSYAFCDMARNVAETMQEDQQADELSGDGPLFCAAAVGVPWRGTAPGALSQDHFLLLMCLFVFVIAVFLLHLTWCE